MVLYKKRQKREEDLSDDELEESKVQEAPKDKVGHEYFVFHGIILWAVLAVLSLALAAFYFIFIGLPLIQS